MNGNMMGAPLPPPPDSLVAPPPLGAMAPAPLPPPEPQFMATNPDSLAMLIANAIQQAKDQDHAALDAQHQMAAPLALQSPLVMGILAPPNLAGLRASGGGMAPPPPEGMEMY